MLAIVAVAALFMSVVSAAPSNGGRGASSSSTSSNINNVPSVNECNYTGGMVCCNSLDFDVGSVQETLLSVTNQPLDANLLVGHGCSPLKGAMSTCNAQAACCEHTYSGVGANCNNLILTK